MPMLSSPQGNAPPRQKRDDSQRRDDSIVITGGVGTLEGRRIRIEHRAARDLDDLRAAGDFLSRAWQQRAPDVMATPGDLEWWFTQAWPDQLGDHLELWSVDGEQVGWSWTDEGSSIDWFVPPRLGLEAVILDWFDERIGGGAAESTVADTNPAAVPLLQRHGFAPGDTLLSQYVQPMLGRRFPKPELPPGYRVRPLRGPEDLEQRVEAHRAAFAPSRMTIDKYRRLIDLPHYRFEHDLVVESPAGEFAAFTMAWWDPVGRVGELEPVGTRPDHRRKGLARAVNLAALRRFAELGAAWAVVNSGASNAASEALYKSVGFERFTLYRRYQRRSE